MEPGSSRVMNRLLQLDCHGDSRIILRRGLVAGEYLELRRSQEPSNHLQYNLILKLSIIKLLNVIDCLTDLK